MYFHIYKDNPTAGAADGTLVSEDNANTSLINSDEVRADLNAESNPIKLAVRFETGWQAGGDTTVTIAPPSDKWALAPDDNGSAGVWQEYGTNLILTGVTDVNSIFWAKAKAVDTEDAGNDGADFSVTAVDAQQ